MTPSNSTYNLASTIPSPTNPTMPLSSPTSWLGSPTSFSTAHTNKYASQIKNYSLSEFYPSTHWNKLIPNRPPLNAPLPYLCTVFTTLSQELQVKCSPSFSKKFIQFHSHLVFAFLNPCLVASMLSDVTLAVITSLIFRFTDDHQWVLLILNASPKFTEGNLVLILFDCSEYGCALFILANAQKCQCEYADIS